MHASTSPARAGGTLIQVPLGPSLSKAALWSGLLLLSACGRDDGPPKVAQGDEHVDCALAGAAQFAPACAVDRSTVDGRQVLVIHQPDGGFRRFSVLPDGTGLAVTDGAKAAQVAIAGSTLEVAIDGNRYRIPFTVKPRVAD